MRKNQTNLTVGDRVKYFIDLIGMVDGNDDGMGADDLIFTHDIDKILIQKLVHLNKEQKNKMLVPQMQNTGYDMCDL